MNARGFTLVELLVSTAMTLCVTAALFAIVAPTRDGFAVQSEASDIEQRVRVSHALLYRDLSMAGAGGDFGETAGPLTDFFAPVLPYRLARSGDPPGSFRSDAITVVYLPSMKAQTTTVYSVRSSSGAVRVNIGPGCPMNDAACGFSEATTALLYDGTGAFDVFGVGDVAGSLVNLRHTIDDSAAVRPAGSRIAQAIVHFYYLKADPVSGSWQLMRGDGDGGSVVPLVDHVVQLSFEYFGDPQPPALRKPRTEPSGPWTTYGLRPPALEEQPTAYPPGENCVFTLSEGSIVPRLSKLDAGTGGLVRLGTREFTDGPWCPDATAANRFDADLLRIRTIVVSIRIESAIDAFRGPAGTLFSRRGTSSSGNRLLPDRELRFAVSPRNLNLAR